VLSSARQKATAVFNAFSGPSKQLLWVRHFETTEELTEALLEVRQRYNSQWLIERLQFQSPQPAHQAPACSGTCK
jgi:hypothetical protein